MKAVGVPASGASVTRFAKMPVGMRAYVIGDVHGMSELLARKLEQIDAHSAANPCLATLEIYLGDLVDRGPDSAGVLRMVIARAHRRPLIALAGNHELYMMRALDDRVVFAHWIERQGGEQTLMSYGIDPPALVDGQAIAAAHAAFAERVTQLERKFLRNMPGYVRLGDYLFVHAGIRPGTPLAQQSHNDLTTIRQGFLDSDADHGFVVIHGHTPVESIDRRDNRIGIDTGAYRTGLLSCLIMDGDKIAAL
jgi:serine/threonine protein phosphatase 1